MYYIWEANRNLSKVRHLQYAKGEGWGIDFLKCQKADLAKPSSSLHVVFECKKTPLPDFFEVEGAIPIVNEKILSALKKAGVDTFQSIPIELHFEEGTLQGYSLLNVTDRRRSIDLEATVCKKWGPAIMRISSLKLKTQADDQSALYRDHNYPMVLFISESVKNALEDAGVSGAELRKADGWSDFHRF